MRITNKHKKSITRALEDPQKKHYEEK